MKAIARRIVITILAGQVRRLRKRNTFTTVGVVGSIGKTSTKLAIAHTLSGSRRVRYQSGNYNDIVSVPLIFFARDMPSLMNPLAWATLFVQNELALLKSYPFDVVVVEIGTDGPGQIADFKQYLHLDIAVVTAIAPEHMENFSDLAAVAQEELSVSSYTDELLVNTDLVAPDYLRDVQHTSYALQAGVADYSAVIKSISANGMEAEIHRNNEVIVAATLPFISEVQLYSATAAVAVANRLGVDSEAIQQAIQTLAPVSGRMQLLPGIKDSTIIDDSYNASPDAVASVLAALYKLESSQKIALLGNMNELGPFSQAAHEQIGKLCDPKQLDHVITLGPDANQFLAPAARQKGCQVTECTTPYEAGEFIASIVEPNAIVLIKGSQNKVFAEEAIKPLLANKSDESHLVRQSSSWLKKKAANFKA
jgi:UDP-N-acetylmuramoyl-tripeptide--D-alanyl-D-alanine ligase